MTRLSPNRLSSAFAKGHPALVTAETDAIHAILGVFQSSLC